MMKGRAKLISVDHFEARLGITLKRITREWLNMHYKEASDINDLKDDELCILSTPFVIMCGTRYLVEDLVIHLTCYDTLQFQKCLQIGWVRNERSTPVCGSCGHFIGGGDWNMCCDLSHEDHPCGFLCYRDTQACEHYVYDQAVDDREYDKLSDLKKKVRKRIDKLIKSEEKGEKK